MKNIAGFTLIELLITITIIGIISSIAYPSYQSQLLKTRRCDAITELIKAQLQQTSLHILNPSYSNNKSELGLINSEYYSYAVISADDTSYVIQAMAEGKQASDTGCTTLTIDQNSNHTPVACW